MVALQHILVLMASFACTCGHNWIKQDMKTTVRFNHDLDSGTCFKSLPSVSYSDCFRRFNNNTFSFNVMVYRRHYLLCKLCFVSKTFILRIKPGFILIYDHVTDTSHENLALGKPTNQSATYFKTGYGYASSDLAVDGIRRSSMAQSGQYVCAHTTLKESETNWWMVDLGEIYPVSKITILNRREDCCWPWLRKLIITVGETENSMQICSEYEGPGGQGETVIIDCQTPLLGRFIRIRKSVREPMVLCEVEVYR